MGKSRRERSSAPSPSLPSTPTALNQQEILPIDSIPIEEEVEEVEEESDLLQLCDAITAKAHVLAPGYIDLDLLRRAKEVVKSSFDRALDSEQIAFPHLTTLLQSINPSSGPTTRSSATKPIKSPEPVMKLTMTPLQELTVEGMELEMVWEQMEMRSQVVIELLEEMFGGGEEEEEGGEGNDSEGDEDDEEEDSEEEEEEDSDEGLRFDEEEGEEEEDSGEDEYDQVGEESYRDLATGSTLMNVDSEEEEDEVEVEEKEDPEADSTKNLTLNSFDEPTEGSSRPQRRAPGPASSVDSTFFSLHDFHVQADEGEYEMTKALRKAKGESTGEDGEESDSEDEEGGIDLFAALGPSGGMGGSDDDDEDEDEDEEEDEDNLDGKGIMYADFFEPPPREFKSASESKGKRKGKGRRMDDEEEIEEEVEPKVTRESKKSTTSITKINLDPTTSISVLKNGIDSNGKRSVRFSEAVKVKTIAARGSTFDKLVASVGWEKASEIFDAQAEIDDEKVEDDEDEEDVEGVDGEENEDIEMGEGEDDEEEMGEGMDDGEEEEEGSEEYESEDDEGRETIDRLKSSLFDEEEEEELSPAAQLSRHERRLLALSSQIATLEAENVGAKDWATKGEAKARDRPVNSLLEEDLEYERSGKVVPIITEETTKTIEDLIKKRILDNQFDDVIRQRAIDPNAFLPSRFMELQDSKSNKSLAEIYEEDYTTAKEKEAGRSVTHELDADLEKKHAEIEELFEELSGKLDALSNARFTPKPPKSTITTITNVASITLENALPTTTSTSTLLAPEEVFAVDPTNEDRSDFTPSMKKQARQKRRKARASIAKATEKFAKGVKGDKERATQMLVGTKGITVLGKGGKVTAGTKRKRGDDDDGRSGVALKL